MKYAFATQEDLDAWGWDPDERAENALALVLRDGERMLAIGGVWWSDGVAWAMFDAAPSAPRAVHRMALQMLRALDQAGERRIYAWCDETRPRAREWLHRLGFQPAGQEVWVRWAS